MSILTIILIVVGVGSIIPIIGSFAICVPKWWEQAIVPRIPKSPISFPELDGTAWHIMPFRLILVLVILPFFLIVSFLIKYWHSTAALIERKCPYTTSDVDYHQQA